MTLNPLEQDKLLSIAILTPPDMSVGPPQHPAIRAFILSIACNGVWAGYVCRYSSGLVTAAGQCNEQSWALLTEAGTFLLQPGLEM